MITRRIDLAAGTLLAEVHPTTILLDIPRGRLPLLGVGELSQLIGELMQLREDLLESSPQFVERNLGHA